MIGNINYELYIPPWLQIKMILKKCIGKEDEVTEKYNVISIFNGCVFEAWMK